jgi:muramoyltetrapeptide carboxypeptidase LdcA involved in peptidoglycan recycling
MIKPRKLQRGGRVAAISLSWGGPRTFPARYQAGKEQFVREFGVDVVETRHALRDAEWLAKNPEARAADLMEAFADQSIDGIISTIGGDDSIRLLPFIDRAVIASNPKVFLGYSDTTLTHLVCFGAGLVSFYGPAFMSGFAENGGMFPYMVDSVRRTCFSSEPVGVVAPCRDGWTMERLEWGVPGHQSRRRQLNPSRGWRFLQGQGVGQGPLVGGCLELLEWLRGTPAWPPVDAFDNAILFFETSEEAPPPKMVVHALRCYAAMGILARLSGILVGRPGGGIPEDEFALYDAAVLKVVAQEEGLTRLPIITRMDFGHTDPMFVLPYGVMARIDCSRQEFSIIENAVVD